MLCMCIYRNVNVNMYVNLIGCEGCYVREVMMMKKEEKGKKKLGGSVEKMLLNTISLLMLSLTILSLYLVLPCI